MQRTCYGGVFSVLLIIPLSVFKHILLNRQKSRENKVFPNYYERFNLRRIIYSVASKIFYSFAYTVKVVYLLGKFAYVLALNLSKTAYLLNISGKMRIR